MNGLNQVRAAVLQTLTEAGLAAAAAFDGAAKQYAGPVVTVDVAGAEERAVGFCSYLGERYDAAAGTVRELYGRQLDVKLSLEVRAPLAADCETAMETAAGALMSSLPSGLRPGELSWAAVNWDDDNRLFLRKGLLQCRAAFTAEAGEEAGTLLDFTLKGVIGT